MCHADTPSLIVTHSVCSLARSLASSLFSVASYRAPARALSPTNGRSRFFDPCRKHRFTSATVARGKPNPKLPLFYASKLCTYFAKKCSNVSTYTKLSLENRDVSGQVRSNLFIIFQVKKMSSNWQAHILQALLSIARLVSCGSIGVMHARNKRLFRASPDPIPAVFNSHWKGIRVEFGGRWAVRIKSGGWSASLSLYRYTNEQLKHFERVSQVLVHIRKTQHAIKKTQFPWKSYITRLSSEPAFDSFSLGAIFAKEVEFSECFKRHDNNVSHASRLSFWDPGVSSWYRRKFQRYVNETVALSIGNVYRGALRMQLQHI